MNIQIIEAQTSAQRELVYGFRYSVYGEELHKGIEGIDHEREHYADKLDEDARILAAIDLSTGLVVGTLRNNCAADSCFSDEALSIVAPT